MSPIPPERYAICQSSIPTCLRPVAESFAEACGFRWVEVEYDTFGGREPDDLRLF